MRILNSVGELTIIVPTTDDFKYWKSITNSTSETKSELVKRCKKFNAIMVELSRLEILKYKEKYENEIRLENPNISENDLMNEVSNKLQKELLKQKRIQLLPV